ncbi:PREDICTED: uncharacterized protein LOC108570498 [Habropoda laboriosa]|uniref:uncharacterized protein LOC108570498 n=1 Tax=Habropoda laboriosa TaxID=597456 RepID=UPI00083CD11F|nr:PREDICTED: uncharacterized protein LOC108570498 [Habropoda laboriosa]
MSGREKSVRPVRQLSLQPPVSHRQQIRRQRSAEDDKPLQICASPFARGKRGINTKPITERPKVRVAWKETRSKNEKELEQVEVVARQIPGRSRPITGRSRGFVGIEKPSILYSRQELAERLRLAWKHREQNKANINIFLARGTIAERCDSEMSSHATITAPSSPTRKNDESECKTSLVDETAHDNEIRRSRIDGNRETEDVTDKPNGILSRNEDRKILGKNSDDLSSNIEHPFTEMEETIESEENEVPEEADVEKEQLNEQISRNSKVGVYLSNSKRKPSPSIDCSNSRVLSTTLPSIKIENSTLGVAKVSKEDFSSAKQKRASFHSGTNRAFLDPIRSPTEFRRNSVSDKSVSQKSSTDNRVVTAERNSSASRTSVDSKENIHTNERTVNGRNNAEFRCNSVNEKSVAQKLATDSKSTTSTIDRNARSKVLIEGKDTSTDNKTMTNKFPVSMKRTASTNAVTEDKHAFTTDKVASSRNTSEIRCSSVNERNPPSRKTTENQRIDEKSRRTSSAPPQRHLRSSSSSNRVQVNIVIDSSSTVAKVKSKDQEKTNVNCKDNVVEKLDTDSTKVSASRSIRSAPLKRRSRSAKRRFWGGNSCKTDEDGKSRNRSVGRGRNSIDSRAIDIVTMVSLVSSADSDSDTENSPRNDKLIDELRSKLPTTSIIKTSINLALASTRKPIKSVSFQKESFDEEISPKEQQPLPKEEKKTTQPRLAIVNQRGNVGGLSNEETVSWRTDIPGLALPVLALIHDIEKPHDVPLTDREKRCLAVPIGDLHDKKRKLLKTRGTTSRSAMERQTIPSEVKIQETPIIMSQKIEVPAQQTKTFANNSPANMKSAFVPPSKEIVQHAQSTSTEPHFQTNKEKECWHLYRKMCDKGVCVSFDTVLRGMLTPTEYRLRQRELSQNL